MRRGLLVVLLCGCTPAAVAPVADAAPEASLVDARPSEPDAGADAVADVSSASDAAKATCDPGTFFALSAHDLATKKPVKMCDFLGKVILVVNVASFCTFTPQYTALQNTFDNYESKGFVIVGFPCNQFGMQEPGDAGDILELCNTYKVTFPLFEKIDVNGQNRHPIFSWLMSQPGGGSMIYWNFTKFLLGRDGALKKRYESGISPDSPEMTADIEAELAK